MLLNNLSVILVGTRFPENVGMVARACANMGCPNLVLVNPERYEYEKAVPLATGGSSKILRDIQILHSLSEALEEFNSTWFTTARIGGWRKKWFTPWAGARDICEAMGNGKKVALVFGPEDRGFANEELQYASKIIHINTEQAMRSLNLAQSVLIVLYECRKFSLEQNRKPIIAQTEKYIQQKEFYLLEKRLKIILTRLHCLSGENPAYDFIKWRHFLERLDLRQSEYKLLMGILRQAELFIEGRIKCS